MCMNISEELAEVQDQGTLALVMSVCENNLSLNNFDKKTSGFCVHDLFHELCWLMEIISSSLCVSGTGRR